jgi:hypothetical protein
MLLDFFVLGLVPGTNLQITYKWLLVFANLVIGLIAAAVVYELYTVKTKLSQPQKTSKTAKQA